MPDSEHHPFLQAGGTKRIGKSGGNHKNLFPHLKNGKSGNFLSVNELLGRPRPAAVTR
jgi:hypothetical protein